MRKSKIIIAMALCVLLTGCGQKQSDDKEPTSTDVESPVSEASTEDLIIFHNRLKFDKTTEKITSTSFPRMDWVKDIGDSDRRSKTSDAIMSKKNSAESDILEYDISYGEEVVWEGLVLNEYIDAYSTDEKNKYRICDLNITGNRLEILAYIEGDTEKKFLILCFDLNDKKYISTEDYDLSDKDINNIPMIDDVVDPMLRSDMIMFAPVDQSLCKIIRSDKSFVRITGLKDKLLTAVNEKKYTEKIGWLRPLAYCDGYVLYYATALSDADLGESGVLCMAVFNDSEELLDLLISK